MNQSHTHQTTVMDTAVINPFEKLEALERKMVNKTRPHRQPAVVLQPERDIIHSWLRSLVTSGLPHIHIEGIHYKLHNLDNGTIRCHCELKCQCFNYEFILKFSVLAPELRELTDSRPNLTSLEVIVEDSMKPELQDLITQSESDQSLTLFLEVFGAYCEWYRSREWSLSYFTEKYPDAVRCPCGTHGQYLQFSHPSQPGASWTLQWSHVVSCEGVLPQLTLCAKAPQDMIALDEGGLLKNANSVFQTMVESWGVTKALDTVIQLTCT